MKKLFALSAALCFFGAGIVGCSNTAQGAAEDANKDTAAVADAGKKAADATVNAAHDAGAAVADTTKKAADATVDAAHNAGTAVANGAEKAVDATANAAKGAGDAVAGAGTTGSVKLAIIADKQLNDPANKINVETDKASNTIVLNGHVASNELKKHAEEVVKADVAKHSGTEKVKNQLTVEAH